MSEQITEIFSWYGEQQVVYLATVDGEQPRVRPMSLIKAGDGFYMITGARGGVDARKLMQIRANPRVEYYMTLEGKEVNGFVRGMGVATIVGDKKTKKKVYDMIGWARSYFDTVDHTDYALLRIDHTGFSYRKPDTAEIVDVPLT
ncbi:pyridoxamine 5'-phosphate oxidase family protein [Candidatus Bathyarchaeota archaeon]|nr:pyridoxamine 5'-phosphate oxidase family protein [Candidatus Bathyarchaeota archaeon]